MTSAPATNSKNKSIIIIGAGPAGLFAAECLAQKGYSVHLFDRMARPGRKFLMAGRSGLNLTHSEPLERFSTRYGNAQAMLEDALYDFPPQSLIQWAEGLGQTCFIGSSGRVFLSNVKASPLLRAWLKRLEALKIVFHPHHELTDLNEQSATFKSNNGSVSFPFECCILAMGGASWPGLGSNGRWSHLFTKELCAPFEPSNCGFMPDWPADFLPKHDGALLKSVTLSFAGHKTRGDLTVTQRGLEGAPLYALSPLLRNAIKEHGSATLMLDFRPSMTEDYITTRLLHQRPRETVTNRLRKAVKLDKFSASLIAHHPDRQTETARLSALIKHFPLTLTAPDTLDRAISTAGGLRFSALTKNFMLKNQPGIFACGEMLDWEAPTGGYLLQACFSTAYAVSKGVEHWLSSSLNAK